MFAVAFDWSVPVGSRGDGFALSLIDLNTAGFGNDFAIDDLSLIEVPGPGGAGVMLVGAGVLSRRRRMG